MERLGSIAGWLIILIAPALLAWGLIGFIGWDWNVPEWPAAARVGLLLSVGGLWGGWLYVRSK